ncbi:MAG: DUF86 domain-containing protein [bacterium]|nr:DUF86 domain-containing protein [bacterium]
MYDEIILSKLFTCLEHIEAIEKYFEKAKGPEQFFKLGDGLNYDATLMRLQALGENLKRISQKHSAVISDLNYAEIDTVIRFRDYVSHHYEQLEHELIFEICYKKIPQLKYCLLNLTKKDNSKDSSS